MNKKEFNNAFIAWHLAIQSQLLSYDPFLSIYDLALQFGRDITTKEHLDKVATCFDYDQIKKMLQCTRTKDEEEA